MKATPENLHYNGENSLNDKDETFRAAFVETAFDIKNVEANEEVAKRKGRDNLPCAFLSDVLAA